MFQYLVVLNVCRVVTSQEAETTQTVPAVMSAVTPPSLLLQAARELVLEVIREKDGDFRSGRNDFSARLGGANLDV